LRLRALSAKRIYELTNVNKSARSYPHALRLSTKLTY